MRLKTSGCGAAIAMYDYILHGVLAAEPPDENLGDSGVNSRAPGVNSRTAPSPTSPSSTTPHGARAVPTTLSATAAPPERRSSAGVITDAAPPADIAAAAAVAAAVPAAAAAAPGVGGALNPRHRALVQRKLDEAQAMERAMRTTVEALAAAYETALVERAKQREAAAEAARAEAEREAAARREEEDAAAQASADAAAGGKPLPPLPTAEAISALQRERARSLSLSSATRRWESRLCELDLHGRLHNLQPSQLVELTKRLYTDAALEVLAFGPVLAPFFGAEGAEGGENGVGGGGEGSGVQSGGGGGGGEGRGDGGGSNGGGGAEGRGGGGEGGGGKGGGEGGGRDGAGGEGGNGRAGGDDAAAAALSLWASRWRAVSSSAMETLSNTALSAADKMEALGEWAPLWPPLESLNRLLASKGLSRLADVHAIVEPLMQEYIANFTTR